MSNGTIYNSTYQYVYFASGPHQRQPRTIGAGGGFTVIASPPGPSGTPGAPFLVPTQWLPPTQIVNGETFNFAFVNVSGGNPPGQTSFDASMPPTQDWANGNITVLVLYVPVGGAGGNGSGATIDAFNETTGSLFDDTFVSVSPDPTGALTTSGNVQGYVDTTNTETITALSPTVGYPPGTPPTNVVFLYWYLLWPQVEYVVTPRRGPIPGTLHEVFPPGISVAGANLAVNSGTSVSALAFYQTPTPPPPPPPAEVLCSETVAGVNGIISTGPAGPLYTVSEWAGIQRQLQECVAQGYLTQEEVNALIAGYNEHVAEHREGGGGGIGRPTRERRPDSGRGKK